MIIKFEKYYLQELYEQGKARNKKYRFQKAIIKQYKKTIDKLKAANRIEDLYKIKSLHYEILKGDKEGIEAVYINIKYRIEFRLSIEGEITICNILELSKHYGD